MENPIIKKKSYKYTNFCYDFNGILLIIFRVTIH